MVTENGPLRYPPHGPMGGHDLPTRRRIPNPPRLDPLRINPVHPPHPRPSTADGLRPPHSHYRPGPSPHPQTPRKHHAYPRRFDSSSRSASPLSPRLWDDGPMPRPTYHNPPRHMLPPPHDRTMRRPRHGPPRQRTPPDQTGSPLSIASARPHGRKSRRCAQSPSSSGLALPRLHDSQPPDPYGEFILRSSMNSAMTSRSSIEHTSGTERSSVLTKSSSITDLSPDTPDGPYEKDEGMSVEDAISMYLDGFSDVTEEPESPDLTDDSKLKALNQLPSAELFLDNPPLDQHSPVPPASPLTSSDQDLSKRRMEETDSDVDSLDGSSSRSLDGPTDQWPSTPDSPEVNPLDRNSLDKRFLGEARSSSSTLNGPLTEPSSLSPSPLPPTPHRLETKIELPGVVPPPFNAATETRDCYGFRKATTYVTLQQYEAWCSSYAAYAANRKVKWTELLTENGLPSTNPTKFPPKSAKVKRFVRKGIPPDFRGAAWFWYAGGYEYLNRNPGLYDQLVRQAMESPTNDDKEHIERDLHRTFPDNIHFKPDSTGSDGSVIVETEIIRSLRRVLYAFAIHNPQIGYTQSLNFITGLLLLFLPEEKAFWMLHIVTSVYLPSTHEISLEGANVDLWILMVLLKESLPNVYNKIAGTGGKSRSATLSVNSRLPDITLGLTNWLMSVFIGTLPLETMLRVWDAFFYEGSKTFFRVSMGIFKACEKEIMAVSDPMEVFQVVQTVPKKLLDANTLLDESFARRNRVGQGRIEELRAARRTAVRQDKLRRSRALSKGQLFAATDEWPTQTRTPIAGIERTFADSWRHMRHHAFR
ncbi:rab-GTPase-TBC domain-containing protein [Aspergillus egyptiacus]|nr:rab-GTPase-TBC domain-containing protein [Aspergillus egyptiacus]